MTKASFCIRFDVQTWRRVTLLAVLTLLPFTPLLEHADVGAPHVAYAQGAPAVYVVTSTDDSAIDRLECLDVESHCSLRGAIQAANAHAGNDTIRFRFATSCGAICTINLNSPLPDIIDSLTITWLGPENLVIRRNKDNNSTTLTDYYRVFTIRGDITVSLTGLFISNGFAKVVHPNTSTEGDEASGGGILIRDATVTITNCVIGSNAAEFRGGGITNYRGTLTVVESEIVNNSNGPTGLGEPTGGGIYTSNLLFVRRSAILTNDTFGRGGGIVAFGPDAKVNVENSTISGNTALHGDGSGGGIMNASGTLSVRNSTIVLNQAKFHGGGIAEGLDNQPIDHYPLTHVKSSIVALNSTTEPGTDTGPDVSSASIFSDGFNLVGIKDATGAGFNKPTDKTGTVGSPLDPQVDTFGFHGGPTRNYSLKTTSPALDAGIGNTLTTDQRGIGFPRTSDDDAIVNATGGDGTDIGSFELEVPDMVPPTIHCTVPTQTAWYGRDVDVSCTASDTGSGLANAADASFTLSTAVAAGTETSSAMTTTRSVCDHDGNCATAGAYTFKVDKKGPILACIAASYVLNAANATVSATVSDGGSGAAVTPATVTANTSPVGPKTATITGADLVGNSTTVSCPYQINYAFTGFLSPIKNPPLVNTGNAGRGWVLSWQLQDANGTFISALSAFVRVRAVSTPCAIPSGSVQPNVGSGPKGTLHYDTTTHAYGYNWLSPRTAGCYELRVEMDSGQVFSALFQLF